MSARSTRLVLAAVLTTTVFPSFASASLIGGVGSGSFPFDAGDVERLSFSTLSTSITLYVNQDTGDYGYVAPFSHCSMQVSDHGAEVLCDAGSAAGVPHGCLAATTAVAVVATTLDPVQGVSYCYVPGVVTTTHAECWTASPTLWYNQGACVSPPKVGSGMSVQGVGCVGRLYAHDPLSLGPTSVTTTVGGSVFTVTLEETSLNEPRVKGSYAVTCIYG